MEIKLVKCTHCGAALRVRNSQGEDVKTITCPMCKNAIRVVFHTETQLAPRRKSGKPVLLFKGVTYPLAEGVNIVGRKADTSSASVQIDTDDRYMSRQHAKITVTRLPDGSLKSVLGNSQNKNATTVNRQPLADEDRIVLQPGDEIRMGETIVVFSEQ